VKKLTDEATAVNFLEKKIKEKLKHGTVQQAMVQAAAAMVVVDNTCCRLCMWQAAASHSADRSSVFVVP